MENLVKYVANKSEIKSLKLENKIIFPDVLRECRKILEYYTPICQKEFNILNVSKRVLIKYSKEKLANKFAKKDLELLNLVFDCMYYNITIDFDKSTISSLKKQIKGKK